ncbi:MAG: (p)ppGpp synthetase [Treponema sp.]|nr:(p)ppGpp synthetase [Treponema sp.]
MPYLDAVMHNIENRLKKNLILASPPTYKSRVKSFASYYKKYLRVKAQEERNSERLIPLTDMMGIRIICAFIEDISVVQDQLMLLFPIKEVEFKGPSQNFKEFAYESIHVLVKIPSDCLPPKDEFPGLVLPEDTVCEIQIRTILQDAWAEVEHELIYKTEFSPFDLPLRRKLASINASLSLADIIFQEIRDYQRKLQTEIETRRRMFYDKADDLDRIQVEVKEKSKDVKGMPSPYAKGSVDDLLLEAIRAHNAGEFKKAVLIYTEIINTEPRAQDIVLSVIHKHRGMAYFTESDYENALLDFKMSSSLDKNNFRSLYYEGIVHSILGNNEDAIDCFSKSLEINEFQSHAFYRRAEAYYEEKRYEDALKDIQAARKLGMNDNSCKVLQEKIIERM